MEWIVSSVTFVFFVVSISIVQVNLTAIVNGVPAILNEFSFMAVLGWKNEITGKEDFLCGGALVSPYFVLTAAHCVFLNGKLPDIIKIGGDILLASPKLENHTVKANFLYPEYDNAQAYNDIALLQLNERSGKEPALFWDHSLPLSEFVVAIGYGTTEFGGRLSSYLQKVQLLVMSEESCQPFFVKQRKFKKGLTSSHLCAGDPAGRKDTCQGDSGGPLLQQPRYIVGITSVGQACSGNPPAIYTRVSTFLEWIEDIISEENKPNYQESNRFN